eukprot:3217652-Karenia_brevis.AAC.1
MEGRACFRCGSTRPPRPIQPGDRVASAGARERLGPSEEEEGPTWLTRCSLPDDFREKIRSLPSATIVHIPVGCREKMCRITAV